MSDILLQSGSYNYDSNKPYEIRFSNATDIILPFQGTVVVPNNTVDAQFSGLYRMMFMSLLYPSKIDGDIKTFPFLRDVNNRPLTVSGPCLFMVADDTSFLDDIDLGQLFDDPTEMHNPAFKANTVLSSTARYFLIQFDLPVASLPGDLLPFSRKKNFKLAGHSDTDDDPLNLKNALGGGPFHGKILAFDIAGQQTEAYSSLIALGVDKPIVGAPNADEMRVQFVNSHGQPLDETDFPLSKLTMTPTLIKPPNFSTGKYFTYNTAAGETLKLSISGLGSGDYKEKFHYAGFWPGYSTAFKKVKDSGLDIEPFDGIGANDPKPTFMRLVLFHPADEFQDTVGGNINVRSFTYHGGTAGEEAVFEDNGFRLFTARNSVKPMNTGEIFFGDYYKEVSKLKKGDKLFQANWLANAHLHLKGSMVSRLVSPSNAGSDQIYDILEHMRDNSLYVPLDEADEDGVQNYLMLPKTVSVLQQVDSTFALDVETNPLGDELPQRMQKGFVRAGSVYGLKLQGDPNLLDHTFYAYWKNQMKLVKNTVLNLDVSAVPTLTLNDPGTVFLEDVIRLEIDDSDPPQAIIKRRTAIDGAGGLREWLGVPAQDDFDYELLVVNLASGYTHVIPLNPDGSDPLATDLLLANLSEDKENGVPGMTGDDDLAVAIVQKRPFADLDFATDLITQFKTVSYSDTAHINGMVPRLTTEYGGLLRSAIAKEVEVRALKWDHILNNLESTGSNIVNGHNNNQQIVATINRAIDGRRGYALIDQSTRELGAWHQKPTVIMKKVESDVVGGDKLFKGIAYLGGMDMALGRWDGDYYYERDPDRQSSKKYDVQIKIDGEASWDVLRNFHHRWRGMDEFYKRNDEMCQPRNVSQELLDDVAIDFGKAHVPNVETKPVKFPKSEAFVQINRTIPPLSCFTNDNMPPIDGIVVDKHNGELGSRASYLKAIGNARKFIMINEQYFFSPEVAKAVRDALVKPDGPEFAIIVLPMKLSESKYIDPLFFKLREKMIRILRYGYQEHPLVTNPCGQISARTAATANPDISDRLAILTPMNYDGIKVYCHSKQILVDDVWMTMGSANMSNRGLTYEGEINAAVMGQKMYKGGSHVVREQRIELSRRLLGLPKAYRSALHDPYAMFRLLKAIEAQEDSVDLNIYPLDPLVKRLDPVYVADHYPDDDAYNQTISFVANVDVNDPSFNYWVCYLLDADGRNLQVDRLGYLARMLGLSKHLSFATGNMGISFDAESENGISQAILNGSSVSIKIYTTLTIEQENGQTTVEGPFLQEDYPLEYVNGVVQLKDLPTNELSITISTTDEVKVEALIESVGFNLKGISGTTTLDYRGEYTFIPDDIGINLGDIVNAPLHVTGSGGYDPGPFLPK